MVLESLVNPFRAEKHPWEMFFIGFVYNTIAIFLALWIFESHASIVMVFFTVMAGVPLIYGTMKMEEQKDLKIKKESRLLKEHSKALSFLIILFLGIMVSVAFWYVVLPADTHGNLFNTQTKTIQDINYHITGDITGESTLFTKIFANNLKVLIFCLLFAFFYGVGAIFILTWNASIIGVAIGNFIRTNIAETASYFSVVPLALARYMTHGIFEIASYFVAGLAGGIISIAVIRHDFGTSKFKTILRDSADMIIIALLLLTLAAVIETFITPALF